MFEVSGCGSVVSSFAFGFPVSGLRVSGFEFRVLGFGLQVWGFDFRFSVRVSGFEFRVSGFGFRVSGLTHRGLEASEEILVVQLLHGVSGFEIRVWVSGMRRCPIMWET